MKAVRQLSQADTLVKPKWSVRIISSHPIVQNQAGRILRRGPVRQVNCVLFFFFCFADPRRNALVDIFRSDSCLSKNVTTLTTANSGTGKICSKLARKRSPTCFV